MTDWYFAGMFDETFCAQVGKQTSSGKTAAEVVRWLVTKAGETDLTWLPDIHNLDSLCRMELGFAIRRKGERVQWVLNPFRNKPAAAGYVSTIGEAIDALFQAARALW
jgi:hypothetical protein